MYTKKSELLSKNIPTALKKLITKEIQTYLVVHQLFIGMCDLQGLFTHCYSILAKLYTFTWSLRLGTKIALIMYCCKQVKLFAPNTYNRITLVQLMFGATRLGIINKRLPFSLYVTFDIEINLCHNWMVFM